MDISQTWINGVYVAESKAIHDERGFFREWFKLDSIQKATGRKFGIEQANISLSAAKTLRGIHYSIAPRGQAKWITCVSGSIKDVVVDIRLGSKTYGKWIAIELKSDSGQAIFISEGLGHGFLAQEDNTILAYLTSTPFSPTDEFAINPLDKEIGIDWCANLSTLKISNKDKNAPTLAQRLSQGQLPR